MCAVCDFDTMLYSNECLPATQEGRREREQYDSERFYRDISFSHYLADLLVEERRHKRYENLGL